MKKILILMGDYSPSGKEFATKLRQYSCDDVTLCRYSDLVVIVSDESVDVRLAEQEDRPIDYFDVIYLRGLSRGPLRHAISMYAANKSVILLNSESHNFQIMSKLEQGVTFALNNIPTPPFIYSINTNTTKQYVDKLSWKYPLVAKSIAGSNGRDNVMVQSPDELNDINFSDFMVQPFLPNDFDYRVIVAGGDVILAYKRIRSVKVNTYKNNIAEGGRREIVTLSPELQNLAINAAQTIGREFCGLDILVDKATGKSYVLEINFNFGTPGFGTPEEERTFYEKVAAHIGRAS